MSVRVKLTDWEQVVDEIERFGQSGTVTTTDQRIRVDFGSAEIEITHDGTVQTGMPLHEFASDGAGEVVLDHDAGTLTVDAEGVNYTFRRPGG